VLSTYVIFFFLLILYLVFDDWIYSCTHTRLYCRFDSASPTVLQSLKFKNIKRTLEMSDSASPTVEITGDWSIQLPIVIQPVHLPPLDNCFR
jgi:hypothetical protein